MWMNCKKCWMYKAFEKQTCACNPKKFNADKLSKKTRKEVAPKPIARVWEKRKKRIAQWWSEFAFFKKLFTTRKKSWENFCWVCKSRITEQSIDETFNAWVSCFPHILSKKNYPDFRLLKNNIWLVCNSWCHDRFDEAVNNYKEENWLEMLETVIKNWESPELKNLLINLLLWIL